MTEMFRTKVVEKIKTHISWSITLLPENRDVCEIVKKKYIYRQATDDNMIRRKRFACWTTEATHTHTHSEYVMQPSHSKNGYANGPPCYVTQALPTLFTLSGTLLYSGSVIYLVQFNQCSKLLLSTD